MRRLVRLGAMSYLRHLESRSQPAYSSEDRGVHLFVDRWATKYCCTAEPIATKTESAQAPEYPVQPPYCSQAEGLTDGLHLQRRRHRHDVMDSSLWAPWAPAWPEPCH